MFLLRTTLLLVLAAAVASVPSALSARPAPTYGALGSIPVGGDGGWDYLTLDARRGMLYVAHGTSFAVVDVRATRTVGTIADTPGAHGMALVPELGRGFVTNGRANTVGVVDLKTLKTVSTIAVGEKPDAILYAEAARRVYAFNGDSKSASVIDPATAKVVATIALGGAPEFAVEDAAAGRIYDNLEDTSEIVAIDEKTNAVVARWPLAPGEEPTGLAIDVAHHRLFAGCGNGIAVAVDATTGKVVASWKIGRGVDACRFDPELGLVFASCGEGAVTIAHEDAPDRYPVVQTLATAPGARTMTLDPTTHRIYLATADLKPAPPPAAGQPRARPTPIPGTFRVLVYGPTLGRRSRNRLAVDSAGAPAPKQDGAACPAIDSALAAAARRP